MYLDICPPKGVIWGSWAHWCRLPMFHCALRPRSLQRWCAWLSGTGCPVCFFWGRFCPAAWHSPPGGGTGRTTSLQHIISSDYEPVNWLSVHCTDKHSLSLNTVISLGATAAYVADAAHALSMSPYVCLMHWIKIVQERTWRMVPRGTLVKFWLITVLRSAVTFGSRMCSISSR